MPYLLGKLSEQDSALLRVAVLVPSDLLIGLQESNKKMGNNRRGLLLLYFLENKLNIFFVKLTLFISNEDSQLILRMANSLRKSLFFIANIFSDFC